MRAEPATGGFTLLEVLVAFTIAAIALAALFQAFSTGLNSTRAAHDRSLLLAAAENRLAEAGITIPLEPGVERGTEDGLTWQVAIAPHRSPTDDGHAPYGPQLMEVEVVVRDAQGREQRLRSLRIAAGDDSR